MFFSQDILKASCKDAMTSIQSVDKKLVKQFMESAKTVADASEGGESTQYCCMQSSKSAIKYNPKLL